MGSEEKKKNRKFKDSWYIVIVQFCLPLGFTLYITGIIGWIIHLIMTSRRLGDFPSVSIGISIVAIPIFLTLLGIFWYASTGMLFNQREDASEDLED